MSNDGRVIVNIRAKGIGAGARRKRAIERPVNPAENQDGLHRFRKNV